MLNLDSTDWQVQPSSTHLALYTVGRDNILLTKVHSVKAMVFPVVIYGCESWTITKAECLCFWTMVLEKTLESSLDCKEIKQSILKDINPEYSQDGLMLKPKLQYFGYLMWRVNSLEKTLILGKIEGRGTMGQRTVRSLDSITDFMDMYLSKLWETVKDREFWHAAVHGVTKNWTWLRDWATEHQVCDS